MQLYHYPPLDLLSENAGEDAANLVPIREVLASDQFQSHSSKVAFALGKDAEENCIVCDLAMMPHLLIAGADALLCINNILISLLYKADPAEVKIYLMDTKMAFDSYRGDRHLPYGRTSMRGETAAGRLAGVVNEMMRRYQLFAKAGARDLDFYNKITEGMEKLPRIVVIIDEMSDLMQPRCAEAAEVFAVQILQMGRAVGIHMVIATEHPDVVPTRMYANMPSRIAFAVNTSRESILVINRKGAEKLTERGEMLYLPFGALDPVRVQGCYISDKETMTVAKYVRKRKLPNTDGEKQG